MSRTSIERRLVGLSVEIKAIEQELFVVHEQLAHFEDSADDARLRSLVSETGFAAKEHRDAAKTVTALRKDRDKRAARLMKLERRQDELLDELLDGNQ